MSVTARMFCDEHHERSALYWICRLELEVLADEGADPEQIEKERRRNQNACRAVNNTPKWSWRNGESLIEAAKGTQDDAAAWVRLFKKRFPLNDLRESPISGEYIAMPQGKAEAEVRYVPAGRPVGVERDLLAFYGDGR